MTGRHQRMTFRRAKRIAKRQYPKLSEERQKKIAGEIYKGAKKKRRLSPAELGEKAAKKEVKFVDENNDFIRGYNAGLRWATKQVSKKKL